MTQKLKALFLLSFISAMMLAESVFFRSYAAAPDRMSALAISITVNKERISGGESITARINRSGDTSQELAVRLESTNPGLLVVPKEDVILRRGESSVSFEVLTVSTPIKTSATIKAFLPADSVPRIKVIEIVPAILKGVSLNTTSMNGTNGSKIDCRVELNAPAPTGGIELYLSPLFVSSLREAARRTLRLNVPNPRVQAGSRVVTFEIQFHDMHALVVEGPGGVPTYTEFNSQTRTVELVVALDPQNSVPWQAIPGIANKVAFDVVPLRVASISVQPTSVKGGGEALATFTLNFPAGSGEGAIIRRISSNQEVWLQLLGSSCQANVGNSQLEMPLTQGVTTYSFKVCTAAVTATTTATLGVFMRTGSYPVQVTVRP